MGNLFLLAALWMVAGCLNVARVPAPDTSSVGGTGGGSTGSDAAASTSSIPGGDAESVHGLDSEFGLMGYALTRFNGSPPDPDTAKMRAETVLLGPAGQIASLGGAADETIGEKSAWAVFSSSGQLETSFGGGAIAANITSRNCDEMTLSMGMPFTSAIRLGSTIVGVASHDSQECPPHFEARSFPLGRRDSSFRGGGLFYDDWRYESTGPSEWQAAQLPAAGPWVKLLTLNPKYPAESQAAFFAVSEFTWSDSLGIGAYGADGNLITTFGNEANGHSALRVSGAEMLAVHAARVNDTGIIFVAGGHETSSSSWPRPTIYSATQNGAFNAAFGTGGVAMIPLPPGDYIRGEATEFAFQPDGKIVVAGELGRTNGRTHLFASRLTATGALDTSFGTAGYTIAVPQAAFKTVATSVDIAGDGRISVVGYTQYWAYEPTKNADILFLELESSGVPLASNSFTRVSLGHPFATIGKAIRQPDRKILAPFSNFFSEQASQLFGALRFL